MIATLLRVHAINLRRDRVGQLMRFLLPIAFFTVFALVFGGAGRGGIRAIDVLVVATEEGRAAARVTRALATESSLRVRTDARRTPDGADTTRIPLDRARAEAMVRAGDAPVAVILPPGLDSALADPDGAPATIELLSDPSNPFAANMVGGLLQKAVMNALPDAMLHRGAVAFDQFGGGLTDAQRAAVTRWTTDLRAADSSAAVTPGSTLPGAAISSPVTVVTREVVGEKKDGDMISFYAAGIAVMFLLFSSSAAAGTLLAEIESGTLDRLLTSGLGMGRLLAGKWLYVTLAGIAQIVVMFVYAMVAFRLDLLGHVPGFLVMTVVTAAAAAAFGVLLATLCRTREQLSGISTLVVLMFSAFGGSMFPRFMMSEGMQKAGLFAFNAWALDGYVKVFWRQAPLAALAPQLAALVGFTIVFLVAARLLARRWETA
jgi:ABC-2 type transport system permease protein